VLAAAAAIERRRLLDCTLAFAGLSAAWHLADGTPADLDLTVAGLALIR
jgi:streptomycin 6-kinase